MGTKLSIRRALISGYDALAKNPFVFFVLAVLLTTIEIVDVATPMLSGSASAARAVFIATIFFAPLIRIMFVRASLETATGNVPSLEQSLPSLREFTLFFFSTIVYAILIVAGMAIFVVPGIFFAIVFSFFPFIMIDRHYGIFASFKESLRITRGNRLSVLWLMLILAAINVLGFLFVGIGVLATVPYTVLTYAYAYTQLSSAAATTEINPDGATQGA